MYHVPRTFLAPIAVCLGLHSQLGVLRGTRLRSCTRLRGISLAVLRPALIAATSSSRQAASVLVASDWPARRCNTTNSARQASTRLNAGDAAMMRGAAPG